MESPLDAIESDRKKSWMIDLIKYIRSTFRMRAEGAILTNFAPLLSMKHDVS